nr:nodulation protein B [uncultured bacterium]
MLFDTTFSAGSIPTFPDRTLCLTFDDGPAEAGTPEDEPGPHSLELAQYLDSIGAHVTFFMVGRQVQEFPGVAEQMAALGHQVAIHTYDHLGLDDYLLKNGGDVVREISLTSSLLPNGKGGPLYMRAPYGQWTPAVVKALNADLMTCAGCFGPIHWDNAASDWDKWLDGVSPTEVAQQYLDEISNLSKGVILMHDNMADRRMAASRNRGLALAQNLVPALQEAGFDLRRVDEIPQIAGVAAATPRIALRGKNQMYVSAQDGGGREILLTGASPQSWEMLTPVPLGSNRIGFQTIGGQYISVQQDGVTVLATAPDVGDWETFEAMPGGKGTYIFRTFTGDYLTIGAGQTLVGNGGQTDANNAFGFFIYTAASAHGGI